MRVTRNAIEAMRRKLPEQLAADQDRARSSATTPHQSSNTRRSRTRRDAKRKAIRDQD